MNFIHLQLKYFEVKKWQSSSLCTASATFIQEFSTSCVETATFGDPQTYRLYKEPRETILDSDTVFPGCNGLNINHFALDMSSYVTAVNTARTGDSSASNVETSLVEL